MAAAPGIAPERVDQPTGEEATERDLPWNVIVWNDPVTLMSYVVYVLRKLFGYDEPTATRLMLQVHHEGKATVASGPREKAEMDVQRLHAHGLQATMAQG
ncbi:MAG: ATP-dependent Clp protease adapter ClpS [Actinomycetota bacterium]|nr:ATP-dependent Clp protease adapter ClpS [Actinomycetota bacterium]